MASTDPTIVIKARDESAKAFKQARGNMDGIKSGAASMAASLAAAAGAFGFGAMIKATLESAKEMENWSNALGVAIEDLSTWQYAAQEVGLEGDKIGDIMKDSADKIGDAWRFNSGEAKDAIESLGIELGEIVHLTPDKQLLMLADRLDTVRTRSEKIHLMEAIGNDLSLMLPLLENGAEGFRELEKEAQALGVTLTSSEADAMRKANDAMRQMSAASKGLAQDLTSLLGPAMATVIEDFATDFPEGIKLAIKALDSFWIAVNKPEWAGLDSQAAAVSEEIHNLTREYANLVAMIDAGQDTEFLNFAGRAEEIRAELDALHTRYQEITDEVSEERGLTMKIEVPEQDQDVFGEGFVDDLKTRQHMYDAAQAYEFARLMEFEDAKTKLVRLGAQERLEFLTKTSAEQTKTVIADAIAVTEGVAHQNKVLFEINKVAGIANAIINTYEGVSKTLAAYPWPLAGAMAALHLASGLAQVSAIESASFDGGSGATSGVGGGAAAAPSDLGTSFSDQIEQPTGPTEIYITVDGTGKLDRDQAEEIANSLAELLADGGTI